MASAQTSLEPTTAAAGSDVELAFVVENICGPAGLTALQVEPPEELLRARPRAVEGWRMTVREGALDHIYNFRDALISSGVKSVEWRADPPAVGVHVFEIKGAVAPSSAGERLRFAATQVCGDGVRHASPVDGLLFTATAPRGGRF